MINPFSQADISWTHLAIRKTHEICEPTGQDNIVKKSVKVITRFVTGPVFAVAALAEGVVKGFLAASFLPLSYAFETVSRNYEAFKAQSADSAKAFAAAWKGMFGYTDIQDQALVVVNEEPPIVVVNEELPVTPSAVDTEEKAPTLIDKAKTAGNWALNHKVLTGLAVLEIGLIATALDVSYNLYTGNDSFTSPWIVDPLANVLASNFPGYVKP